MLILGYGDPVFVKNYALVHLPYILNHLSFSAHILTQGRSLAKPVPLGSLVDFGLGASFLGQKTTFLVTNLVHAVSLEPLGVET